MFRTPIKIERPNYSISHEYNIFLIGSCFAENIYRRLGTLQYSSVLNPFGILFNPFSISNALENILSQKEYKSSDLFKYNGLWHSYDHHGEFSDPNQSQTIAKINKSVLESYDFLMQTDVLIITLGTANVFELKSNHEIVANCHKVPNHEFERKRLSVDEIVNDFSNVFNKLIEIRPNLKIILTVSPIRHIRDGFIENQRSKSILLLAVAELEKLFSDIFYFPSYEILMDDLRDYRFYAKDMIHPNEVAIDYIWEQFSKTFFSDETMKLNQKVQQVVNGLAHRLLHPETDASLKFLDVLKSKMHKLEDEYPFLNFDSNSMNF